MINRYLLTPPRLRPSSATLLLWLGFCRTKPDDVVEPVLDDLIERLNRKRLEHVTKANSRLPDEPY